MCVVSNIGDMGRQMWPKPWGERPFVPVQPKVEPKPWGERPFVPVQPKVKPKPYNGPTREQFEEFLKLMRAAKQFDVATGQPDCEQDDKVRWILELADHLGVSREEVRKALS